MGVPLILCWQMYNNEFHEDQENGYWLIDDQGVQQPLYHTHHHYYQEARRYVADFRQPEASSTADEYRQRTVMWLQ